MQERRLRGNRGSALVEAAVYFPPLFLVLLASLDIGQFMMRQQGFVDRVRDACRYAIVSPYDETKIRNVVLYGADSPSDPTADGLYALKPEIISVSRHDMGDEAAERITITIHDYPMFLVTPGLAGRYTARPVTQSITKESMGNL